ncbi:MAG: hypothetical protein KGH63_01700, partial [Candidatus Micrarchaeota archaeon]|nr:hypothetical protein [Candidatus Micrarchaeota archaeon]
MLPEAVMQELELEVAVSGPEVPETYFTCGSVILQKSGQTDWAQLLLHADCASSVWAAWVSLTQPRMVLQERGRLSQAVSLHCEVTGVGKKRHSAGQLSESASLTGLWGERASCVALSISPFLLRAWSAYLGKQV